MQERVKVTTQGISGDLSRATGEFEDTARGRMSAEELTQLLKNVQHLSAPNEGPDECPPHVMAAGPAGDFSFMIDGGTIFCDELGADLSAFEAAMLALGHKSVEELNQKTAGLSGRVERIQPVQAVARAQTAAAPAPSSSGFVRFLRWILALVVAGTAALFGIGGGVALVKNSDDQTYQLAGIFLIIVTLTLTRGIFRLIRGPKGGGGAKSGRARDSTEDGSQLAMMHHMHEMSDDSDDHGGDDGGDFD